MDSGAWRATVQKVAKSQAWATETHTLEQINLCIFKISGSSKNSLQNKNYVTARLCWSQR